MVVGRLAERLEGVYDFGLPGKFCQDRCWAALSEWNIERDAAYHWGASMGGTARKKLLERVFRP